MRGPDGLAADRRNGGRPGSRTRDPQATRARILLAAREEFCERGLDGARIDRIADLAEVNKRMLYHYFGNKEGLYTAVLGDAYAEIRQGERMLQLDQLDPEAAMERLVRFTFRHFLEKPWFIRLLTTENLHHARFLKSLSGIKDLHSPLVRQIDDILHRGSETGVFRGGVDPVQLYISIAGLGYFYVGNRHTLSVIFARDLGQTAPVQEREAHAVDMVLSFLRYGVSATGNTGPGASA